MPHARGRSASVTVSVVIPALNEAENLRHVLPRVPVGCEVVLVDGGSSDQTIEIARALRSDVCVVRQSGSGKGNAVAEGFAAARGDIIVMLDADGSARPEEIEAFVDALLAGADLAKGSRYLDGGGSADLTFFRSIGNRGLGGLVNFLFGVTYTDLCYGYNAMWRDCVDFLGVDCDGFEVETLINIRAVRSGLRVVEVPSYEDLRIHGTSNLRPVRDGLRILRTIIAERIKPRLSIGQRSRETRGAYTFDPVSLLGIRADA